MVKSVFPSSISTACTVDVFTKAVVTFHTLANHFNSLHLLTSTGGMNKFKVIDNVETVVSYTIMLHSNHSSWAA